MDPLPTSEILRHLEHGQIEMDGYVPWGSNYTFIVTVHHDEQEMQAVYKPRQGERPLWDFPTGTLCSRERAAYLISHALDWHIVPPTILCNGPNGWGSLQYFIDHDPDEHYFTFNEQHPVELRKVALFDLIINNADRKGGHIILDENRRVWAIDHGIALHDEPKLRTVVWDFVGERFVESDLADMQRLLSAIESSSDLCEELSYLLSQREMQALKTRLRRLTQQKHYPNPGPGRPYPWPLV